MISVRSYNRRRQKMIQKQETRRSGYRVEKNEYSTGESSPFPRLEPGLHAWWRAQKHLRKGGNCADTRTRRAKGPSWRMPRGCVHIIGQKVFSAGILQLRSPGRELHTRVIVF